MCETLGWAAAKDDPIAAVRRTGVVRIDPTRRGPAAEPDAAAELAMAEVDREVVSAGCAALLVGPYLGEEAAVKPPAGQSRISVAARAADRRE